MRNFKIFKGIQHTELAVLVFNITLTLAGLFLFLTDLSLYRIYLEEDGFIEYITFFLLFGSAVSCFIRGLKATERKPVIFYFAASLIFLFGAGEEISWGQRIFGFNTPEGLENINKQKEFTLHNIYLFGVEFNKLIFGTILYGAIFLYFLLFPLLYKRSRRFHKMAISFQFPIAKHRLSLFYFLSFFLILSVVPDGYPRWELQEFVLSSYIFLSFLYPQDKSSFSMGKQKQQLRNPYSKTSFQGANREPKRRKDLKKGSEKWI